MDGCTVLERVLLGTDFRLGFESAGDSQGVRPRAEDPPLPESGLANLATAGFRTELTEEALAWAGVPFDLCTADGLSTPAATASTPDAAVRHFVELAARAFFFGLEV